ncbi:hypothetical protein V6N11_012002 [Hibiscus sabdariffa]|uniref:Uncharacterized protein n=1 Tax=Hibiscus sabdariffa TaxID=183260 RepID=A0ABR2P9N9_9ROSI
MVPGQVPTVTSKIVPGSNAMHRAITILEEGKGRDGGKGVGLRTGVKGNGKKKLRLKKKNDIKISDKILASDWSHTINVCEASSRHQPIIVYGANEGVEPPVDPGPTVVVFDDGQGVVLHLDKLGFDHRPLLLQSHIGERLCVERLFRFVFAWQEHLGFQAKLLKGWDSNKRQLIARLKAIDCALNSRHLSFLIDLERSLKSELDIVLEKEEILWAQKS